MNHEPISRVWLVDSQLQPDSRCVHDPESICVYVCVCMCGCAYRKWGCNGDSVGMTREREAKSIFTK